MQVFLSKLSRRVSKYQTVFHRACEHFRSPLYVHQRRFPSSSSLFTVDSLCDKRFSWRHSVPPCCWSVGFTTESGTARNCSRFARRRTASVVPSITRPKGTTRNCEFPDDLCVPSANYLYYSFCVASHFTCFSQPRFPPTACKLPFAFRVGFSRSRFYSLAVWKLLKIPISNKNCAKFYFI